jgi:hypothetical protein
MRKIAILSIAVAAMAFLLVSCASGPKINAPQVTQANKPKIIDDQYHGSRDTPEWIFLQPNELEAKAEYKDAYVFVFVQQGKDVDGLKLWVRGFAAASEVARMVSTRVQDKFAGAAAGDKDKLETYIEEVVKSVSEAQYSGARKAAEYWWQVQKTAADKSVTETFEYYLLYTVPKTQIDQAIKRSIDGAASAVKPKTEDEQTARDRVKKSFDNGLGD